MYNPDVSTVALATMANLEVAKYNGAMGTSEGGGGGKKRKSESIRKHYFAMQRRLPRCRHFDTTNATEECKGKENLSLNNDDVNNNSISDVPM